MTLLRTTRRANDVLSTRTMEIRLLGTTTMQISRQGRERRLTSFLKISTVTNELLSKITTQMM